MKSNFIKTILLGILTFLLSMPMAMAVNEGAGTVEGMQGISPPKGTSITASSTYSTNVGTNVFDNNLKTLWVSKGKSEYLQLNFPNEMNLKFIQLAVGVAPLWKIQWH
ncbi:discoidin domain-containing protein [Paenibacillus kribbensis]|uniref:discoidin domain-containing protein n=1 Tax=Paenibacillus kribbensis TaxID=172713 RepID=UPI00211860D7|nr:discoidin domain-containing protein [Paenibacillus kribbensis]